MNSYIIVKEGSLKALEREVNRYMKLGYQAIGGIQLVKLRWGNLSDEGEPFICQAMQLQESK